MAHADASRYDLDREIVVVQVFLDDLDAAVDECLVLLEILPVFFSVISL